jgi:hypothetical protein
VKQPPGHVSSLVQTMSIRVGSPAHRGFLCSMKNFSLTTLTLFLAVLTGCQTGPFAKSQKTPLCPVIQATACPVCKVQNCPQPTPTSTSTPTTTPTAAPTPKATTQPEPRLQIIGEREWALVEPGDIILEARIDTGAATSSIHAENIQLIEKDGKRWVRFNLSNPQTGAAIPLERRLHRRILVKQKTDGSNDRRYVVRMWLTLGETRTWADVSLSNRDAFEFPLLIGRNMLMDNFSVDVSSHHTLPKPVLHAQEQ